MHLMDSVIIVAYFIGMLVIALLGKKAKSMADFAVGSRAIPTMIIVASLSATYIGPGYSLGLVDKAASQGYVWYVIFLAFSLQTVLTGWFVAPRLNAFSNAYTLGDVMGQRYGRLVQLVTGIMSVVLCAGFIGAITRAAGDIISTLTPIPFIAAVALSITIVVIYSTLGGVKTIVITDVIQFTVLAVSIPLTVFFIAGLGDGIGTISHNINEASLTLGGHFSWIVFAGLFISFLFGEVLIPPYANRALMAKDQGNAKWGFIFAGLFSACWFLVCATLGIFGSELLSIQDENNVLINVMQQVLPVGLFGLAAAGIIAVIMSSQSSLLNAAAVSFSQDIIATLHTQGLDNKKELLYSKLLTIGVGISAAFIALKSDSIVDALLVCYTLWAPTIVFPVIIATFKKNAHPLAALAAIVGGGAATAIWHWGLGNPGEVPAIVVGIAVNQVLFWSVQGLVGRQVSSHSWFYPQLPQEAQNQ